MPLHVRLESLCSFKALLDIGHLNCQPVPEYYEQPSSKLMYGPDGHC